MNRALPIMIEFYVAVFAAAGGIAGGIAGLALVRLIVFLREGAKKK